MNISETCIIDGCHRPLKVKSRRLCNLHYRRFQRHGEPTQGRTLDGAPLAFLRSLAGTVEQTCVPWPFARHKAGHGVVYFEGRMMAAGRAMCILTHGDPTPEKPEAAHTCGRGHEGCVNPNHVYWGSHADNYQDRVTHGVSQRGKRHGQAKLDEGQVKEIRALCDAGVSRSAIGRQFGVARQTINSIAWRHIWDWVA